MKIVFATNNQHKLDEIRAILGTKVEVVSLADIGCHEDILETGQTLEENALQKAEYVYNKYHLSCFADDTGLEVEALNGAPGVYSARYAALENPALEHDSEANMARLLRELQDNDNRKARFRTVIALVEKKDVCPCGCTSVKQIHRFEGIVDGEITRQKSGAEGFGYDPIFKPEGYDKTFAELGADTKNKISHRAKATEKLAKFLTASFIILFALLFSPVSAQIGTWRNYLAYHDVQQIQAAGNELFVLASNNLYQYNKSDNSITTYDKINGLNDTFISQIRWCQQARRLIAVYANTNIDLIETNGNITNISDIYSKAITGDKSINDIYIYNQYAYLSCGFGIVKLNVKDAEVSESYMLGMPVTAVTINGSTIYAQTEQGVLAALLTDNLIDKSSWKESSATPSFEQSNSDYEDNYQLVSTLKPGGPKYNYFFNMKVHDNTLYTVGGGWYQFGNFQRPGTIQVLESNKEWTIFQDDIKPAFADAYNDVNAIAIDPLNSKHIMVASCSGLYEFQNGIFQNNYTEGNTDYFESAASNGSPSYVRTDGIVYDKQGNMYCLNSASSNAIIMRSANGEWSSFMNNALIDKPGKAMRGMVGSIIDSRGLLWFANKHSDHPAFFCYNRQDETIVKFNRFVNEDGASLGDNIIVNCIDEDLNGYIWIGTNMGPVYITSNEMADNTLGVIQYKVPRNDGTDYADYLLAGIDITCIAIDKAGRKWFGTNGNGIYLISADNNTQEQHFTIDNSKLLSNVIESIAINDHTGEVFFGTDKGLCSYVSDATTTNTEMTSDNVWAYPNPVEPSYTGLITITGLTLNADVKILAANGALVASGKSNGGTFTWDGCDKNGKRVASGVYMVATATSDGNKGTVCKIAIIR